jgi:DNA-binding Lrp family transcriptional regulator
MLKIDANDRIILYQLDLNARQSLNSIGSKIRKKKNVVQYRINRLIKTGVIKNFYTSIDFYKLGYINLGIYINYQYYTPKIEKEIIDYFVKSKQAWFIANVQGKFDLIVLFTVKNLNEFFSFWKTTLGKYRFYFQNALISFFTKTHYYPISYVIDGADENHRHEHEIVDGGPRVTIDDKDEEILKHICMDSRKPLMEIAQAIDTSSTTVANRVKHLEKQGIINRYRIHIDYTKLGLQLFNIQFNLRNYNKIYQIINHVKHNQHLISATEVIDNWDLSLNFHIRNFDDLHVIIKDIYNTFPSDIKNHMTFNYPEIYKQNYMPTLS